MGEGREGVTGGCTKEWRRAGSWYRGAGWGIQGQVGRGEGREGVSIGGTTDCKREGSWYRGTWWGIGG